MNCGKIKDWNIDSDGSSETSIYSEVNGNKHLIRTKKQDLAYVEKAVNNIIITVNDVRIVIDDSKKLINILQK